MRFTSTYSYQGEGSLVSGFVGPLETPTVHVNANARRAGCPIGSTGKGQE
jgi:hypothetical protein